MTYDLPADLEVGEKVSVSLIAGRSTHTVTAIEMTATGDRVVELDGGPLTITDTPRDPAAEFLAEVAAEVRPRVQAELQQMAETLLEASKRPSEPSRVSADARLAAAARTRTIELGPLAVSHVPYGNGWRLSRGRWFVAVEVPGHELLIASRRWWHADEAGE